MAYCIDIPKITDERGSLCVIDKLLPFEIKRVYYLFDVTKPRGNHRHHITRQALICLSGHCRIYLHNGEDKQTVLLENNNQCLIVEPEDWHTMADFSDKAILLVLASHHYDGSDYIYPAT